MRTPDDWSELVRHLRQTRGWSQEQLAAAVGTTGRNVSGWERGERVPRTLAYRAALLRLAGEEESQSWKGKARDSAFRDARVVTEAHELLEKLYKKTLGHGPYWRAIQLYLGSLLKAHDETARAKPTGTERTR